ncbi:hypothetical protein STEG23_007577, partial [Scotinomys teguina]
MKYSPTAAALLQPPGSRNQESRHIRLSVLKAAVLVPPQGRDRHSKHQCGRYFQAKLEEPPTIFGQSCWDRRSPMENHVGAKIAVEDVHALLRRGQEYQHLGKEVYDPSILHQGNRGNPFERAFGLPKGVSIHKLRTTVLEFVASL